MQQSAVNPKRVPHFGGVILEFLRSRFSREAMRQRAQRRRELSALYSADDRTLKDVGVTRDEIRIALRRSDLPF